jgi:hypothetical protein
MATIRARPLAFTLGSRQQGSMAARGRGRYDRGMSARGNLADPACEPSDGDLARLMHDAFEHVAEAREESLRTMRARIDGLQAEAWARFEAARRASSPAP